MESSDNIHFIELGLDREAAKQPENDGTVFWGHGWGQNHKSFLSWAQRFSGKSRHILIDFPGFGESPVPNKVWGTDDYAAACAELIRKQCDEPIIWVGHSFGCRVGLQLAARYPELIKGIVLVAGAGLPRKRPLWHKVYYGARVKLFKALKKLIPLGLSQEWLYTKFGSADYKSSGALRQIFVKVVNEDLSTLAATINCPTLLIYGEKDTETPPEIGMRLNKLIENSDLIVLNGFDHYTLLSTGQHQAAPLLGKFINSVKKAS